MFGDKEKLVLFTCSRCGIQSLIPKKNAPYIRFIENVNGQTVSKLCICLDCWRNLQNAIFKGGGEVND